MIEVKNLYKNFDEIEVLKDISTVFRSCTMGATLSTCQRTRKYTCDARWA